MLKGRKFFLFAATLLFFVGCADRECPADRAAREGILLVGNSADPESLDPALATGFSESRILNALFEGLVCADTKTLQVRPAAAKSWTVSADGLKYTFHLDERAKWSDGVDVCADDFVFAWRRALRPTVAAEYATLLSVIKNADEIFSGRQPDVSKLGVRALSKRVLEVELQRPCPYFLSLLYMGIYFPLREDVLKKFGADKFPNAVWTKPQNIVSNGPFKLARWSINDRVCVRANPYYRAKELIKLKGVDFFPISNLNTEDRAFRTRQLHLTDSICPHRIGAIKKAAPETLRSDKWLGVYYYIFNTMRKPFDDRRVRMALSLAIDRDAIIDGCLKGGQDPAYSFVPEGCGGFKRSEGIAGRADVARARELLAQAGYPGGKGFPKIKITYNVSEQHKPIAEAIQQMWRKNLGIEAQLYNLSWPAYLAARRAGDFDVARASWVGDFAEPESFLNVFLKSSALNHTGWSNEEFDTLVGEASGAATKSQRLNLLARADAILASQAPIMPIYYYSKLYQISPQVKNWNANLLDYHDYKGVYLTPSEDR